MDSNNNDTQVPEDQPEEQALQLNVKDFAYRSKAKAKPPRREPANYSPSIIPMNARNWIDIEPGKHSLSAFEVSKKVIHLLRHSQKVQGEDDGAIQFWRITFHLRNQDVLLIFILSSTMVDTWRSEFKQETDGILSACCS